MRMFTCLCPECTKIKEMSAENMKKHLAEVHQINPNIRVPRVMLSHVDYDNGSTTTYKYFFEVEVLEYVEEQKEKE